MINLLFRNVLVIISFLILVISLLWFYFDRGFESLLTIFGSILALIKLFMGSRGKDKIKTFCHELQENLSVAKGRRSWTTYSIKNRALLEELRRDIKGELYQKLINLYLDLETTNEKIKGVSKGWWGDDLLNSYYSKLEASIQDVISSLKLHKQFNRYLL